jgi:hypothetical protein
MSGEPTDVMLDLRGMAPAEQHAQLHAAYKAAGAGGTVRVLLDREPARLCIGLLESDYRCTLRREGSTWWLVGRADSGCTSCRSSRAADQ